MRKDEKNQKEAGTLMVPYFYTILTISLFKTLDFSKNIEIGFLYLACKDYAC